MNTNFQVRRMTGYDPGYPVGRRRPGRLEARPLKFLFLVVGFLFFFVGFGCTNKVDTTGVQVADDDTVTTDTQPDDYVDNSGVPDTHQEPDDNLVVPDTDEELSELGGAPLVDEDMELPDYDDQLAGELAPDEVDIDEFNDLSGGVTPDDDMVPDVCPVDADDQLTGDSVGDVELPDVDDALAGDPIPDAPLPDVELPDYDGQLAGIEVPGDDDYLK